MITEWTRASACPSATCVEIGRISEDEWAIRDSGDPTTTLLFNRAEIVAFLDGARKGEFDKLI